MSLATSACWTVLLLIAFFASLTGWLRLAPQLKIFRPVIRAIAVNVMHIFISEKRPVELFCHDEPVLQKAVLVLHLAIKRQIGRIYRGGAYNDVTGARELSSRLASFGESLKSAFSAGLLAARNALAGKVWALDLLPSYRDTIPTPFAAMRTYQLHTHSERTPVNASPLELSTDGGMGWQFVNFWPSQRLTPKGLLNVSL